MAPAMEQAAEVKVAQLVNDLRLISLLYVLQ
jgi:hypothetical protein